MITHDNTMIKRKGGRRGGNVVSPYNIYKKHLNVFVYKVQ